MQTNWILGRWCDLILLTWASPRAWIFKIRAWNSLMSEIWRPTDIVRKRLESILHGHDDDVTTWKHFPRYWPLVRGIHRPPVNSPHKGQWGGALMFSLMCAWMNGWVNNRGAGDLRCHRAHYDVTVTITLAMGWPSWGGWVYGIVTAVTSNGMPSTNPVCTIAGPSVIQHHRLKPICA